jgi:RNA polymerase sporulation-specific sigma factor
LSDKISHKNLFLIAWMYCGRRGDSVSCARTADLALTEDRILAQFAREGDDEALIELLRRYEFFIKLRSSQVSFVGLEAEDLIQEGMIGLFSAVQNYRAGGGASFRTYALLCIKRRMLSAIRSASRQKHMPLNNYVSLDDEANAQAVALTKVVNLEDMIVCREDIGALKNVVEKCLTSSERGILNMYISGITYAAIAEVFNVSIKFIDNSLQRIKKKLIISVEG